MPARRERATRVAVDRIACTGHGVCAALLPRQVTLDETAVRLCPARALRPSRTTSQ
jgi:ferredoxin